MKILLRRAQPDDAPDVGRVCYQAFKSLSDHHRLAVDGGQRVQDAYGSNFHRLSDLLRRPDPGNFFSGNQNILTNGD
jgi:hypothetical protein